MAHVTVETRRVYRSARGCKLTKHAAYIAAAKHLIAQKCALLTLRYNEARAADGLPDDGWDCDKEGRFQCVFHARHERFLQNGDSADFYVEDAGPVYYLRVLPRLVRFLKFVDQRELARQARKGNAA